MRKLPSSWPELAAAAAAAGLYGRTLAFGFVFDDHSLIDEHGPRLLGGEWLPYRPLRFASLWVDQRIGGGAAWAYHLTNVALHALAAVLVVRLCRRAGASGALALACALPFIAHPLTVEAVAYVAGRRDLLAAVFGLVALMAWAGARSALAIACVMLAVAAKEVGIVFVALLLAAAACGIGLELRRALSPLMFATVAAIALPVAYGAQGPLAPHGAVSTRLAVAGSVAAHYLRNIFAPHDLSIEYPELRCAAHSCASLTAAGPLAGLAVVIACVAASAVALAGTRRLRRVPAWTAFALTGVAIWLVALSFVVGAHEPGADRHAYLLLGAISIAVAAFTARARPPLRRAVAIVLVVWAALLAGRTSERISVWRNDLTLW